MRRTIALALLLSPLTAYAQSPCAEIRTVKEKTYGFHPSKLTAEERKTKSDQMDAFWTLVKSQKGNGTACLQDLLTQENSDGFFLFDGSSLLYSLDQSDNATRVVIESLQHADLDEVNPSGYLQMLLGLSMAGADVGPLAARYLEHANVTTTVPLHAMTLDRATGALVVYGSMPPERADQYLTAALSSKQTYARAVAALLLAMSMTENGFKILSNFDGYGELPADYKKEIQAYRTYTRYRSPKRPVKFNRGQVLDYLRLIPQTSEEFTAAFMRREEYKKQHPEAVTELGLDNAEIPPFIGISGHTRFIESAIATLTEADLPAVREARRKSAHGLSDETLYEFFAYTRIIEGVINRLDLYKDYRLH